MRSRFHQKTIAVYTVGLLLPVGILFCAFAWLGVSPFGNKSILINDLSSQYVDFFAYYRDILRSGNFSGLLYSFSKGPGGNFFGIFTYYLASPFNLILLFFDNIEVGVFVLTLLKSGLSSVSLILYISQHRGELKIFDSFFGLMYALCSYFIANSYQLLWLDGMIFLPLIILGMEHILLGKSPALFVVSLSIMTISSYYITYMIALFTALYFTWYCIVHFRHTEIKLILNRFLQVFKNAFYSLCIAGVTLLPSYFALLQGKSEKIGIEITLEHTFSLSSGILKLFPGHYDNVGRISAPYIYCGMLISLLVLGFFFLQNISLKAKLATLSFFVVLFLSMYSNTLHTIWHLFAVPEAFPYRFSFVVCFLLVSIASYTFDHLANLSYLFWAAGILILGLLFIKRDMIVSILGHKLFYYSAVLIVVFLLLLAAKRFVPHSRFSLLTTTALVLVVSLDMFFNTYLLLQGADKIMGYENAKAYRQATTQVQRMTEQAERRTSSFFRLENLSPRSLNDAFSMGYFGTSHFSSLFEKDTLEAMRNLGYANRFYALGYSDCIPARDSLLGIAYIIAPVGVSIPYTPIYQEKNVVLYHNEFALPLFYIGDSKGISEFLKSEYSANEMLQAVGCEEFSENSKISLKELKKLSQKIQSTPVAFVLSADNRIDGKFVLEKNQVLYTTIPYDSAWKIQVDGQRVTPIRYLGNFTAMSVPIGQHNFTMQYIPRGLFAGETLSILSLTGGIVLMIVRHRKGKGKVIR